MKVSTELILSRYETEKRIDGSTEELKACVEMLLICIRSGGKVLVCGNGGSCADADHIVGELIKKFRIQRPLDAGFEENLRAQGRMGEELAEKLQSGIPAINLGAQAALITAMINDVGGDFVFAQQVAAYGNRGDILLGISTSGNSKNVLYAGIAAKAKGMKTIGLCGKTGGKMKTEFDLLLSAQADCTEDIQDQHSAMYHAMCAAIENELWGE